MRNLFLVCILSLFVFTGCGIKIEIKLMKGSGAEIGQMFGVGCDVYEDCSEPEPEVCPECICEECDEEIIIFENKGTV